VWAFLSDPAVVASCIPGATLTKAGAKGAYQGTMRVKFGPTVAQFRGEARRCSIEGRGIDGRGASRANAFGAVEASGTDTTVLKVEGNFNVIGPLETFANGPLGDQLPQLDQDLVCAAAVPAQLFLRGVRLLFGDHAMFFRRADFLHWPPRAIPPRPVIC
jgi:carbon monoxide dehydrogenase subunit G